MAKLLFLDQELDQALGQELDQALGQGHCQYNQANGQRENPSER